MKSTFRTWPTWLFTREVPPRFTVRDIKIGVNGHIDHRRLFSRDPTGDTSLSSTDINLVLINRITEHLEPYLLILEDLWCIEVVF